MAPQYNTSRCSAIPQFLWLWGPLRCCGCYYVLGWTHDGVLRASVRFGVLSPSGRWFVALPTAARSARGSGPARRCVGPSDCFDPPSALLPGSPRIARPSASPGLGTASRWVWRVYLNAHTRPSERCPNRGLCVYSAASCQAERCKAEVRRATASRSIVVGSAHVSRKAFALANRDSASAFT